LKEISVSKLRIHNITAKAALKFGSEAWVLKKREEQHLEAAQMKFLRHLLGITKLDKEKKKNQCIREKNRSREYSKRNKTVPGKVATTHTVDGHKRDT
jgi:hypothetical protein